MRLALDAMGGDDAPQAMVQGAIDYARNHSGHVVVLVGQEAVLSKTLSKLGGKDFANIEICDAPEVIGMGEKISALKDKPNDSMNTATRLVKDGKADAVVLCGNTACSVAAAQLHLRRIPGVKRAGILTPLPRPDGKTWVIDCGANSVGKPEHLVQFGEMASIFLRYYIDKPKPLIGVLNIGSEDGKGDSLTGETLQMLRESKLNVLGNVEGNDIYKGTVDIVVCDGFTGNVVLKTSEGVASAISKILREEIHRGFWTKIGGLLTKPAFRRLKERVAWTEVGGCLLLGVNGLTVIGHGRSNRTAVCNALGQAARCVEVGVVDHLRQELRKPAATS